MYPFETRLGGERRDQNAEELFYSHLIKAGAFVYCKLRAKLLPPRNAVQKKINDANYSDYQIILLPKKLTVQSHAE